VDAPDGRLTLVSLCVPDAVQREACVDKSMESAQISRSGAPLIRDRHGTVPRLQRIISLRFMLRCARDTRSA
jgi:hypothetical protein